MSRKGMPLAHFLLEQKVGSHETEPQFRALMSAIAMAGKVIAREVRRAGLVDILGYTGQVNIQGESVKKLDRFANDAFVRTLENSGSVCLLASEEIDKPLEISVNGRRGRYVVLFDPLDGSSNIEVNGTLGSIFSIFAARSPDRLDLETEVLRSGREQVAAGYIMYGPSTLLVYTDGRRVHAFTLELGYGEFLLTLEKITIPPRGHTYSANQGNFHDWEPGTQRYIHYLQERDKATGRPYSLRYVGTLVADLHRTLLEGGVFLYPAGKKHPQGKLRLLYEVSPMALIVEAAGGRAYAGKERVLDIQPEALHQRAPLVIGSAEDVEEAIAFMQGGGYESANP